MARRIALPGFLFTGCIGCLLLAARADSAQPQAAGGPFKPVASVRGLMTGQGIVYKQLQAAIDGPKAADRPMIVQLTAEALAEFANVNTYNSEKQDYRGWAAQLRENAMELSMEAKKKASADDAKMKQLFARIEATCQACHDAYQ